MGGGGAFGEVGVVFDPGEGEAEADGEEGGDGGAEEGDDAHDVAGDVEVEEGDEDGDEDTKEDGLAGEDGVGAVAVGGEAFGVAADGLDEEEGEGPPDDLAGEVAFVGGEVLDGAEVPVADGGDGEGEEEGGEDDAGGEGEEEGALVAEVALGEADGDGLVAEGAEGRCRCG